MLRKLMKLSVLPVVAASLVFTACENGGDPSQSLLGPQSGAPAFEVIETTLPSGFKVVQETDPTVGYVSGVIGELGGSLSIGSHKIVVPAGAVHAATVFTLIKPEAGKLAFSLRAQRDGADVGGAGFDQPVKLVISFASASVDDPTGLVIGWAKPDGSTEFQSTFVSTSSETASADLAHFSDYILAIP